MLGRRVLPAFACVLFAALNTPGAPAPRMNTPGAQDPDISVLRTRLRSGDLDEERAALLELGRFQRPSLIPVIVPALRSPLADVRARAADAVGQAAQGWRTTPAGSRDAVSLDSVIETLIARLPVEPEPAVRAALSETIGRLPYATAEQVRAATAALVHTAPGDTVADRLGIAEGLEALVRLNANIAPAADLVTKLLSLTASDPSRDARVRRLALGALINIVGGDSVDAAVTRAASDPDMQVRRLAMRASANKPGAAAREALARGVNDKAAMVRVEALRGLGDDVVCNAARAATADRDSQVALMAFDELARCGGSEDVASLLEATVNDLSGAGTARGWHKAAHALVALAAVRPERARAALPQFVASRNWPLRMYAARAAAVLKDRTTLEGLSRDENDLVRAATRGFLESSGSTVPAAPAAARSAMSAVSAVTVEKSVRPSSLRARVTVRDVGSFEMALLPVEAPLTVAHVVSLAESGYYNGLVIQRVVPNLLAEVGPAVVEPTGLAVLTRNEAGPWPHVRGAVGMNDASAFFVNLTDNPQFDHQYTVFAQLLNGMDVVDALLEGDIIERVDIVKP